MAKQSQKTPKIKFRIHFKDMHQDCLRWDLDKDGNVVSANLQTRIWKGSIVDLAYLELLTPGNLLPFKNKEGFERSFKYPITKVERL